jgi:hypothetical protein
VAQLERRKEEKMNAQEIQALAIDAGLVDPDVVNNIFGPGIDVLYERIGVLAGLAYNRGVEDAKQGKK